MYIEHGTHDNIPTLIMYVYSGNPVIMFNKLIT